MQINLLGVHFDPVTMAQAQQRATAMLDEGTFHYVVTPNAEFVQLARKEEAFCAALNGADMALPDGIGVILAAKILGTPLPERVSGCDFAQGLCEQMAKNGKRLFLLGAKPGVAEQAGRNLMESYPGLTVCGAADGYFKDDAPVVEAIRQAQADVVFVCLGAPKQEYWMVQHGTETGASIMVGLGGSLDVFAGTVKRAPRFWQKLGLEWFYRLVTQPWRIKRMAKLPLLLFTALGARLRGKK